MATVPTVTESWRVKDRPRVRTAFEDEEDAKQETEVQQTDDLWICDGGPIQISSAHKFDLCSRELVIASSSNGQSRLFAGLKSFDLDGSMRQERIIVKSIKHAYDNKSARRRHYATIRRLQARASLSMSRPRSSAESATSEEGILNKIALPIEEEEDAESVYLAFPVYSANLKSEFWGPIPASVPVLAVQTAPQTQKPGMAAAQEVSRARFERESALFTECYQKLHLRPLATAAELLRCLHGLHSKGLVHGNLKPNNVMFTQDVVGIVSMLLMDLIFTTPEDMGSGDMGFGGYQPAEVLEHVFEENDLGGKPVRRQPKKQPHRPGSNEVMGFGDVHPRSSPIAARGWRAKQDAAAAEDSGESSGSHLSMQSGISRRDDDIPVESGKSNETRGARSTTPGSRTRAHHLQHVDRETDELDSPVNTLARTGSSDRLMANISAQSDIFAAGCLIHFMYTQGEVDPESRHPFGVEMERDNLILRKAEPCVSYPTIPCEVQDAILRMIDHDPAGRWSAARLLYWHPMFWTLRKRAKFVFLLSRYIDTIQDQIDHPFCSNFAVFANQHLGGTAEEQSWVDTAAEHPLWRYVSHLTPSPDSVEDEAERAGVPERLEIISFLGNILAHVRKVAGAQPKLEAEYQGKHQRLPPVHTQMTCEYCVTAFPWLLIESYNVLLTFCPETTSAQFKEFFPLFEEAPTASAMTMFSSISEN